MLPKAIVLRNYRSFAEPVTLELRPLTLLYGANNHGKSSLLRALPLLDDSLSTTEPGALNLDDRLAPFELNFDSLRWKGRKDTDSPDVGIGLRWEDPELASVDWLLGKPRSLPQIVVNELTFANGMGDVRFRAVRREQRGAPKSPRLLYDIELDGTAIGTQLMEFRGPSPSATAEPLTPSVAPLIRRLEEVAGSVLWLRSLRPAPRRSLPRGSNVHWSLKPDGTNAPLLLDADSSLREEVSSFYEQHFASELRIEESVGSELRTVLRNRARSSYDIDLLDTGEGVSQLLPVLTAVALLGRHRRYPEITSPGSLTLIEEPELHLHPNFLRRASAYLVPSIIAIEEPEAHLHPDTQRALAEHICDVVAKSRSRIVLETHSEVLLLAVRLRIAKGLLRPEDVVIYRVHRLDDGQSRADRIEIDERGRFVGNWPPDEFSEDLNLSAEILDAVEAQSPS